LAKKSHAIKIILQAVHDARQQGIQIVRQPMFDWTGPEGFDKPKSCDATGAVLLSMGFGHKRPEDWPVLVQKHLGVGVYWLYAFWMGWSYARELQIDIGDGHIIEWKPEQVSKMANKLAKQHVRRSKCS